MSEINDVSEMSEVLLQYQSNDAIDGAVLLKMKAAAQLFFEKAQEYQFRSE